MDGRRFVFGLAAGLLLGLAIVASSGGLGSTPISAFLVSQQTKGGSTGTFTTTTAATTATTTQPPFSVNPGNTSIGSLDGGTNHTTTITTSTVAQNGASGSPPPTPAYSSNVQSIGQQSLASNAVVFIPLLVALLLGAVLYRASARSREGPDAVDG